MDSLFVGDKKMFLWIVILLAIIFVFAIALIISYVRDVRTAKKNRKNLIGGLSPEEVVKITKEAKKKKRELKGIKYPFKKIVDEYVFFGGDWRKLVKYVLFGYVITFLIYLVITRSILCSIIFSIYFFLIAYMILSSKNKKKRMSYLKSFSSALEILSSSIEAGDSLESAITNIQKRERLNPKILNEFAILSNNLKSNMSLDESLEHFWKRNNVFEEFSMFVIVLQFFMKSGGRNLSKMFNTMKVSVQQKVENYSTIESKIGSYNMLFKIFVFVNIGFSLIGGLFIDNFYNTLSNGLGILQAVGSVVLTFMATYIFNMFVRGAAEA